MYLFTNTYDYLLGSRHNAQHWEYSSVVGWDSWEAYSEMEISVQESD